MAAQAACSLGFLGRVRDEMAMAREERSTLSLPLEKKARSPAEPNVSRPPPLDDIWASAKDVTGAVAERRVVPQPQHRIVPESCDDATLDAELLPGESTPRDSRQNPGRTGAEQEENVAECSDGCKRSPDHSVPKFQQSSVLRPEPVHSPAGTGDQLDADYLEFVGALAPDLLPSRHGSIGLAAEQSRHRADHSRCALTLPEEGVADASQAAENSWAGSVQVDLTLSSLRGYSQGVSDVIGTLDFDTSGSHFATGGIARKIRVYSLENLAEKQAELMSAKEDRKSRSSGEDPDDSDEEAEQGGFEEGGCRSGQGVAADESGWVSSKRRHLNLEQGFPSGKDSAPFFMRTGHGGLRRKQKAASTSNLADFFQRDSRQRLRERALDSDACANKIICAPAKISSLQWVPGSSGRIGCGDYDGVFSEWDIETGLCVAERDEHQGQKIWSIRYRQLDGTGLSATASEDGTARLWTSKNEDCVGSICPSSGSAVCSVDFSPDGNLLAMGVADSTVYLYDLRQQKNALAALQGHERTVSYVRFLDGARVVTSSIDSTLKVWDVTSASNKYAENASKGKTARVGPMSSGSLHVNRRNFVGLAVRGDGMVLTGSETNHVVGYQASGRHLRSLLCVEFRTGGQLSPLTAELPSPSLRGSPFVSAICWQSPRSNCVGVADSEGTVKLLKFV